MNKEQSEVAYAAVEGDPDVTHNDGSGQPLKPVVQGWPVAPKAVSRSILLIITDVVLLLLPLGFLGMEAALMTALFTLTIPKHWLLWLFGSMKCLYQRMGGMSRR